MPRLLSVLLVCSALLLAQDSRGDAPAGDNKAPKAALLVGKWKVEFTNGVMEVCNIGNGGESSVEEPRRRSTGVAAVQGNSVVITFNDNRVERWTPIGNHFIVEHWFPSSRFPSATPVLGIAERAP